MYGNDPPDVLELHLNVSAVDAKLMSEIRSFQVCDNLGRDLDNLQL